MKIKIWSIGKAPESYIQSGIDDYAKRLVHYFTTEWKLINTKHAASLTENEVKKQEGEMIVKLLNKKDFLVLMDERGKQFSSEELAAFIEKSAGRSKDLVFLIGGAFGVDETVKQSADFIWSLSKLVFPHALAKLVLAEQLYRAATIINHEKYHHK